MWEFVLWKELDLGKFDVNACTYLRLSVPIIATRSLVYDLFTQQDIAENHQVLLRTFMFSPV